MKRGHIPMRTCRGCGRQAPQDTLVRLVRCKGVVQEDSNRQLPGRGVYCCSDEQCRRRLEKNKKNLKRLFRLRVG